METSTPVTKTVKGEGTVLPVLNEAPHREDVSCAQLRTTPRRSMGERRTAPRILNVGTLSPGGNPGTHPIGGWVSPRSGLEAVENGK